MSRGPSRWLGLLVAFWSLALASFAQEPTVLLEMRVTDATLGFAFVDAGRLAGLRVGDEVRFLPVGRPPSIGEVLSVSANAARVRLRSADEVLAAGTRCEAQLPRERLEVASPGWAREAPAEAEGEELGGQGAAPPEEPGPDEAQAPEHPPWEAGPVEWDERTPLLAEVVVSRPDERPIRLDGRVYLDLDAGGTGSDPLEYQVTRLGTDIAVGNPFGFGGELGFDGEVFYRDALGEGIGSEGALGRLDRLSYGLGLDRERDFGFEAGRFFQRGLPRLGTLDGAEFAWRRPSGDRFGLSAGFVPARTDTYSIERETQLAASYTHAFDETQSSALTLGVQKTWFQGRSDRDLLLASFQAYPDRWSIFADVLVDYYSSSTDLKDAGFELTEASLSITRRFDAGFGGGLLASSFRWADLLRNEVLGLTPEQVGQSEIDRVGLRGWWEVADALRVDARIDRWQDPDRSGTGGELRLTLRDLWSELGELSLAAFRSESAFGATRGVRLEASQRIGAQGFLRGGYTLNQVQQDAVLGSGQLEQHLLQLNYDNSFAEAWDYSLYVQDSFGGSSDILAFGLLITHRF